MPTYWVHMPEGIVCGGRRACNRREMLHGEPTDHEAIFERVSPASVRVYRELCQASHGGCSQPGRLGNVMQLFAGQTGTLVR